MINLHAPSIGRKEWIYIKKCIDTKWVSSSGKYVDIFENKIAKYTGSKYAIACVNGTSALQVSIRLAGVLPGDEVIVPSLSFIAPVNAINYNGAKPVFMDADNFFNIDIEKTIKFIKTETKFSYNKVKSINKKITFNKKTGNVIRAIVVVHNFGNAVKLDELVDLCRDHNIVLIEDAAESIGTFYKSGKFKGKHTGTIGKLGCLSFNGNKIITTGSGGIILTSDKKIAKQAKYLTTQAKNDPIYYIHNEVGYNFRLNNIQAALGLAQLERLPYFLKKKKKIREYYLKRINNIKGLSIALVPDYAKNNHWLNILHIYDKVYPRNRDTLIKLFKKNNIQTRPIWYPNHLQKPYKNCYRYKIKSVNRLINKSLCLPSGCDLTLKQINTITKILRP